jgi:hypothetical protein
MLVEKRLQEEPAHRSPIESTIRAMGGHARGMNMGGDHETNVGSPLGRHVRDSYDARPWGMGPHWLA